MSKLKLSKIDKIYPNGVQAVFGFDLDVEDGEFIVLVGPSGCGKSTTLRMIAGLEGISSGDMILAGERVNKKAPVDRDIAMVFQNYALYPTMSVYDNMGISLKVKHEDEYYIHETVREAANNLDLNEYLNRLPSNLSGGQQQRVALGRSVVRKPKLFLMDEPLSNLDAKLREKTRSEIVRLQKELNITTVYVTHDQIEAMTMADRIVVMNNGYVQQVGSSYDVYNYPINMFVGGFMGLPPMNFIKGTISNHNFVCNDFTVGIPSIKYEQISSYEGKSVFLGVRAENFGIAERVMDSHKDWCVTLPVTHTEFLGSEYYVSFEIMGKNNIAKINSRFDVNKDSLEVAIKMDKVHFYDPDTEIRINKE